MITKRYLLITIGFLTLFFVACNNDDAGNINNGLVVSKYKATQEGLDVNDFMWKTMNVWYFWQQDVNDLLDTRFANDEQYTQFLAAKPDPEGFMESILFNEDRFTFWNEDYTTLVNNLSGISKSNGLEFGLVYVDENRYEILGYVRYVVPNSNASTQDIKRGDIFTKVNGNVLNVDNYRSLLFGDNDTYTLTLSEFQNSSLVETSKEITLTKEENLVENPVFIAKTLYVQDTKVAYLMYNGFIRDFNDELNNAFGQFIADGATELVVDFRYNPGGSVQTSAYLASMIYGNNTNDLYIRQRWNDKLMGVFDASYLEDYFANTIKIYENGVDTKSSESLHSLNLSNVYFLTTSRSASASELVINGLDPYIEIVQIGETTRGKNEFSITLVDDPIGVNGPFTFGDGRRADQINPENSWAIQPLVGRNENSAGFSDYTNGLAPDIELEEDLANLGILGDPNEPLLARALQEITGSSAKIGFNVVVPAKVFTDSKMFKPLKDIMVLDKELHIHFE